jgi:thioredoxin 1
MNKETFLTQIKNNPRPVVVDVWAPWCMPCRAMAPALERVEKKFDGQVDLWKLNPDEDPELVRALQVMSIPTMIAFRGESEINRHTGTQNEEMLSRFFDSALTGEVTRAACSLLPALYACWLARPLPSPAGQPGKTGC